jgi:hypothetical protein
MHRLEACAGQAVCTARLRKLSSLSSPSSSPNSRRQPEIIRMDRGPNTSLAQGLSDSLSLFFEERARERLDVAPQRPRFAHDHGHGAQHLVQIILATARTDFSTDQRTPPGETETTPVGPGCLLCPIPLPKGPSQGALFRSLDAVK